MKRKKISMNEVENLLRQTAEVTPRPSLNENERERMIAAIIESRNSLRESKKDTNTAGGIVHALARFFNEGPRIGFVPLRLGLSLVLLFALVPTIYFFLPHQQSQIAYIKVQPPVAVQQAPQLPSPKRLTTKKSNCAPFPHLRPVDTQRRKSLQTNNLHFLRSFFV